VDFPAHHLNRNHASRPQPVFLNGGMQHEPKIPLAKRIAIAKLHDGAQNDPKFPLAKCNVFAKAAWRTAA
jgi:hypothetical protein